MMEKLHDEYEYFRKGHIDRYKQAVHGSIVVRGKDRPIEVTRQADSTWFLNSQWHTSELSDSTAVQDWDVFMHHIRQHTGSHSHQGGLVIYVVEGTGWTMVDGRKVPWKAGDLLLLPVTPGGVEHQHFNADDGSTARWIAFIYRPMQNALGSLVVQSSDLHDIGIPDHLHSHDPAADSTTTA
jgi:mannose-6-phosphate isomerase-like protein (cupin superfamily)